MKEEGWSEMEDANVLGDPSLHPLRISASAHAADACWPFKKLSRGVDN